MHEIINNMHEDADAKKNNFLIVTKSLEENSVFLK